MERFKRVAPFIASVLIFASTGWAQAIDQKSSPQPLIAAGSGVNLGITRLLAKAFMDKHPQTIIEVPGSIGTKGAITAVNDGAITFGLISRPLKKEETTPTSALFRYARVPIVVGAHPGVADNEITSEDLVAVYRGTKTRWKDGGEIVVQSREPFDSGFIVLQDKIPGFKEAYTESQQAKRWSTYFTDQDANRALSATPNAIGVTDLGMVATEHLPIKVLQLNGIVPSPETLSDERYPLSRDLFILYREGTLSNEAKAFLDFIRSEEGGNILRSNGYLALN
jgi:phosphate transport system substrate-binding protein